MQRRGPGHGLLRASHLGPYQGMHPSEEGDHVPSHWHTASPIPARAVEAHCPLQASDPDGSALVSSGLLLAARQTRDGHAELIDHVSDRAGGRRCRCWPYLDRDIASATDTGSPGQPGPDQDHQGPSGSSRAPTKMDQGQAKSAGWRWALHSQASLTSGLMLSACAHECVHAYALHVRLTSVHPPPTRLPCGSLCSHAQSTPRISTPVAYRGDEETSRHAHGRASRAEDGSKRTHPSHTLSSSRVLRGSPPLRRFLTLTWQWTDVHAWPRALTGGAAAPMLAIVPRKAPISSSAEREKRSSCGGGGDLNSDRCMPAAHVSSSTDFCCSRAPRAPGATVPIRGVTRLGWAVS